MFYTIYSLAQTETNNSNAKNPRDCIAILEQHSFTIILYPHEGSIKNSNLNGDLLECASFLMKLSTCTCFRRKCSCVGFRGVVWMFLSCDWKCRYYTLYNWLCAYAAGGCCCWSYTLLLLLLVMIMTLLMLLDRVPIFWSRSVCGCVVMCEPFCDVVRMGNLTRVCAMLHGIASETTTTMTAQSGDAVHTHAGTNTPENIKSAHLTYTRARSGPKSIYVGVWLRGCVLKYVCGAHTRNVQFIYTCIISIWMCVICPCTHLRAIGWHTWEMTWWFICV